MHTGAGDLNGNLNHFNEAMDAIYGHAGNLREYLAKAQAMNYDGERAMYEAYDRNKYQSTGVVQWMLNNGWPSMMWHLYDYYLEPAGGYFGAKKAGEPVHIQYSYDDRGVVVVNNVNRDFPGLTAEVAVYSFDLRKLYEIKQHLDSPADSVRTIWTVPEEKTGSGVHFVRLTLTNAGGHLLSSNFYWLPRQPSSYDWSTESEKKHPYYTGVTNWEDMKELNQLKTAAVRASAVLRQTPQGDSIQVRIHNPSRNLAFQVHLNLVDAESGEEILPILWDDNYISLLPGESRSVGSSFASGLRPRLEIDGWNVESLSIPVENAGGNGANPHD
jgi:exo-1,4-beta-D-glucosaminidase